MSSEEERDGAASESDSARIELLSFLGGFDTKSRKAFRKTDKNSEL